MKSFFPSGMDFGMETGLEEAEVEFGERETGLFTLSFPVKQLDSRPAKNWNRNRKELHFLPYLGIYSLL